MKLSAEGKIRLAARLAFLTTVGAASELAFAQTAATPPPETPATAEAAAPATAETTDATTPGAVKLESVQVTGSRLRQPNLTSTSSMTLVTSKEFALQGTTNVESLLNSLPQSFAEFSTGDSNGATGTATVNLRNLGSSRTLVLVDGRRLSPGDPLLGPQADLNFIPSSLVDRVEILSGGASAIYGSDAIAGVVNFIMKKDFEGFRLDSQVNGTDEGDGSTYDATAIFGTNFAGGKGYITAYAGYSKTHAITQDKRDFSKCSLTTPASGDRHLCQGSRVIAEGRILSYDRYYSANPALNTNYYAIVNPNGTRSFINDDGRTFNFAPFNYLQRPDNRYTIGSFAHYELNDHVELFGSAMFMDDRTVAQIAPSGLFGQTASVPCNSPLLSAQQRQYLCTDAGLAATDSANVAILKRTTEVGPRQSDLRHTDYRIQFGSRGDLMPGLGYELSAQRGEVIYSQTYLNDVSVSNARNALNITTNAAGQAVCVNDAANGCVPFDVFQIGAITPAQANYVRGIGLQNGSVVEQVVSGALTSELGRYGVQSPWAKTGAGFALGYEYRTEDLDFRPDATFQRGDLAGQGGPTPATAGGFQVNEVFGELSVPVIDDLPFVKLLQLDGAYRYGNYSNRANDVQAYKLGLKWSPTSDATLRYSYQRATRAPSIQELTAPVAQGLFGGSDPCAGENLRAAGASRPTQAQCANSGVTAAQYQTAIDGNDANGTGIQDCNAGQCNGFFGGNPNLKAEISTTRSIGLVLTPTFFKGFSATFDYFDINVGDAIQAFPQSTLVNCIFNGSASDCAKIQRAPTGRLSGANPNVGVQAVNSNTATLRTKGVDVEANYRFRLRDVGLPGGSLAFGYNATYLTDFSQGLPGATFDCVGLYGINCGTPLPEYRHKLRATWETPIDLAVSLQWRYYGSVELDKNQTDPNLKIGAFNRIDNEIGVKQYVDISGLYTLPTEKKNLRLRFGVSNVGGQNPPTVSSNNPNPVSSPPFGNGNTFPNVYDSLGRVGFIGLTADF